MKEIYLAGGCFWGMQAYFDKKPGIIKSEVGYANGYTKHTNYDEVCSGITNHAETIHITFDEDIITLDQILDLFWKIVDPTSLNKQGGDKGTQYRTGIFYINNNDLIILQNSLEKEQALHTKKIVTEVLPLTNFTRAEEYHQKYLEKNPNGYCHIKLD